MLHAIAVIDADPDRQAPAGTTPPFPASNDGAKEIHPEKP